MKNHANIVVSADGRWGDDLIITAGVDYEYIGHYTGSDASVRMAPGQKAAGLMINAIDSDRLPDTIAFPVFGRVIDCGSGILGQLLLVISREGNVTANGHCASEAYHNRAVRTQVMQSAAERFQKALSEREAVSNRAPVKASVILAEHFR